MDTIQKNTDRRQKRAIHREIKVAWRRESTKTERAVRRKIRKRSSSEWSRMMHLS